MVIEDSDGSEPVPEYDYRPNWEPEDVCNNIILTVAIPRIIACVKGCTGIENPEAVKDLLEACEAAMVKIEAYENCSPADNVISAEDMPEEWELCRAAVAKAKGGA